MKLDHCGARATTKVSGIDRYIALFNGAPCKTRATIEVYLFLAKMVLE